MRITDLEIVFMLDRANEIRQQAVACEIAAADHASRLAQRSTHSSAEE